MAGKHITYYANGQVEYEAKVFEDVTENNVYHKKLIKGWVHRYFENGNPERSSEMVSGKASGNEKQWWENGYLRFEGVLTKNDQRISKYYDQSGPLTLYLEEKKSFEKGYMRWIKHGLEKRYKNNILLSETRFRNGKGHGNYKRYYESGKLASEGTFYKGKIAGLHQDYHENGQLKSSGQNKFILNWQGDTIIVGDGWFKRYFENGKIDYEAFNHLDQTIYSASYSERGHLLSRSYKMHDISWSQEYYPGGILKSDYLRTSFYDQKAVWFITGQAQMVTATSHYPQEQTFEYSFDGGGSVLKAKANGKTLQENNENNSTNFSVNDAFYQNNVEDDQYQLTYGNAKTRIEISLKNGLPDEAIKVYRPDGSLALYAEIEQGLSRGRSYYLSPKGDTIMQQIKGPGKELNRKIWSSDSSYREDVYNQQGNILYQFETYPGGSPELLADEVNKIYKRWNPDGTLNSESKPIGDNINHIQHKTFFENGRLRDKYFTEEGKRNGEYWLYHENGELFVHTYYKNDKQHGLYERYDKNGKLYSKGETINGKKEGFWQITQNGKMDRYFYKDDKRQVTMPKNTCACLDTTQAIGQISYIPAFHHLLDYRKYKNAHFSFLQPLAENEYRKLFYKSSYGSNADIITFKPFILNFDKAGKNTLSLNRCHTGGYLSSLSFNLINRGQGEVVLLDQPKFQLTFAHKLMYQQKGYSTIQVNISPSRAEFSEKKYIETDNSYEAACFEPIKMGKWRLNSAKVKMLPNIKTLDANDWFNNEPFALHKLNLPQNFQKKETQHISPMHSMPDTVTKKVLTERLIGIVAVQGQGSFTIHDNEISFNLRYMWLTNDWGSGSFDIEAERIEDNEKISLKTTSGEVISFNFAQLEETLTKDGFKQLKVEQYKNQNKIKVGFWVE
jgi:antitoxin component YwqK of YwqJK toxin-antitoxin module